MLASGGGVVNFDEELPGLKLGGLEEVGGGVQWKGGHMDALALAVHIFLAALSGPINQEGFQGVPVFKAAVAGGEAGIAGPIGVVHEVHHALPLVLLAGGDADVTVPAGKEGKEGLAGVIVAAASPDG